MASGSFNLTKSSNTSGGGYIIGKIDWSSSKNTDGNYSSVTATLYCKKASDSTTLTQSTSGSWKYSLSVAGNSVSGSVSASILTDWVKIASKTVSNVSHDADGTKTITISGSVTAPDGTAYDGKQTSGSKSVALDTIPRASTVSATNANIGSKTTISIKRASSSFTHTLTYSFEGLTGTIATKTSSTSVSWTVPTSFYEKIPDRLFAFCDITCDTYNGSTKVGSSTCSFEVDTSEADCAPVINSVTSEDTNDDAIALTGDSKRIIAGVSNLNVITNATAKNSATISSILVTCGNRSIDYKSVIFDGAESASVTVKVTDSRGYSTTYKDTTLTLVKYIQPTFVSSVKRYQPTGDTICVSADGKWFNGSFGSVTNVLTVKVRYKEKGGSYGSYQNMTVTNNGNSFTATLDISGLSYQKAYDFQISVGDKIYAVYGYPKISKGLPVFDWGENDFEFHVPVNFVGTNDWVSLGLSSGVSASSSDFGRCGSGCYYRVVNGNHVFVAFNCSFTYDGAVVYVGSNAIPEKYRPARNVYAMCATGGRAIARIFVNNGGGIGIDWIQILSSSEQTTSSTVNWIDGYIDYWI